MTTNHPIKLVICEPSPLIRRGLADTLKRLPGYHIMTIEVSTPELLLNSIQSYEPDMVIINPVYNTTKIFDKIKKETSKKKIPIVAIINGSYDKTLILRYDAIIELYETAEQLQLKLNNLFFNQNTEEIEDETETLSIREKEILKLLVKGLTNREIASSLFLSTHTVITHRRNIARKLGIHSTAGLTIYAILNKYVDINDLNP